MQLSLVNPDKQEFPELPEKQVMSAPGALKGDGSGKKAGDVPGDSPENYTGFAPTLYEWKMTAKAFYLTDTIQLVVAGVIFLNFIVVMFSVTQFVLDNKNMEEFTDLMDTIFISFFLAELVLNMGTTMNVEDQAELFSPFFWQWEFVVGGNWAWNWFDFIVIVVPIVMAQGWASSIRILRLFRVIRVLKSIAKFEALQVVASSVSRSMSGVGATAIFILITLCMYAIIAVEMFGKVANGDDPAAGLDFDGRTYTSMSWQQRSIYANENCEGVPLWQYFGNLRRSMLTMFVFTTVEGWPDLGWCLGKSYAFGSAFCTSFIIITALLMANIVVAIFTNKMEEAQEEVEREAEVARKKRQASINQYLKNEDASNVQGVDLDGDGIADEFVVDLDGDGVADVVMSADEMNQAKGGGVGNSDDIMKLLRQIAKNVDTLMADKAQKGKI